MFRHSSMFRYSQNKPFLPSFSLKSDSHIKHLSCIPFCHLFKNYALCCWILSSSCYKLLRTQVLLCNFCLVNSSEHSRCQIIIVPPSKNLQSMPEETQQIVLQPAGKLVCLFFYSVLCIKYVMDKNAEVQTHETCPNRNTIGRCDSFDTFSLMEVFFHSSGFCLGHFHSQW